MNRLHSLALDLLHGIAIVLLCILFAVVYGVCHDQITARICVEYFTIGHPPVFKTDDPTLLGLGWGVIATWWVGLIMGAPLAVAARIGKRPKRNVLSLARPLAVQMSVAGICALVAGIIGYMLAKTGTVFLVGALARDVPADHHAAFLADGFAHNASYFVGFFGGLVVIAWVWWARGQDARSLRHFESC